MKMMEEREKYRDRFERREEGDESASMYETPKTK